MAPKVPAVIKKTLVMLAPVYIKKIEERDAPIRAAKTQKVVCAFAADIFEIPKLMILQVFPFKFPLLHFNRHIFESVHF